MFRSPRTRIALAAMAATALGIALTGCATGVEESEDASSSTTGDTFPVTIEHALGETVIETQPERVAAIAWSNQDVPLALGVVPVGMDSQVWAWTGDAELGVYEWTQDAIDELGGEEPREVTRRVAEAAREARHALTFDDAVGDQTHRPAGHVAPQVPLRRARRGLGEAALARAESRLVRRRRRGVEGHVRLLRRARRAARAAIDARGPHGGDELPVEATIAGPDDAIPLVEGHHGDARRRPAHVSTLPRPNAAHSRKSAIAVRG